LRLPLNVLASSRLKNLAAATGFEGQFSRIERALEEVHGGAFIGVTDWAHWRWPGTLFNLPLLVFITSP